MRGGDIGEDAADEGSTLLLTLGYALLSIALVLVTVNATSLYIAQRRLDGVAAAAALAGADGFRVEIVGDDPRLVLADAEVASHAQALVETVAGQTTIASAASPDGVSARVMVETTWHPVLLSPLVPDGVLLTSTGTARIALR